MRAPPPMFECLIPCFVISRRGPAFRQSVVIKVTPTAFVLNQKLRYLFRVLIPWAGAAGAAGAVGAAEAAGVAGGTPWTRQTRKLLLLLLLMRLGRLV